MDPAHSLRDVLPDDCTDRLTVEELDAAAFADRWLDAAWPGLAELVGRGTYLDAGTAEPLLRTAVRAAGEAAAALRLSEIWCARPAGSQLIVDTPPIGAALRVLAAGESLAGWRDALDAMAAKAVAVSAALAGPGVPEPGVAVRAQLEHATASFADLLASAGFVVVERASGEADRLAAELVERGLRVVARIGTGPPGPTDDGPGPALVAPMLPEPTGCDALRQWRAGLRPAAPAPPVADDRPAARGSGSARRWLEALEPRLLLFAGKGGTGRTTCAAAVALGLAQSRPVRLLEADRSGDAGRVLGEAGERAGIELRRVDPEAAVRAARARYEEQMARFFHAIGMDQRAALDRQVVEQLWKLAPPGADEAVAVAELLGVMNDSGTIVVDAAATGHFVRLIAMPEFALRWAQGLLALLRQHAAAGLGDAVDGIGVFAEEVRGLRTRLTDARATAVFVVTVPGRVVRAETDRLIAGLAAANLPLAAVILNRSKDDFAPAGLTRIVAPVAAAPPTGAALLPFLDRWELRPWAA